MTTLPEFVEARLADKEARARSLLEAARIAGEIVSDSRSLGKLMPGWDSWPDVEAMCEQALREVVAMRALLAEHQPGARYAWNEDQMACTTCGDVVTVQWPCATVRALVAIWSDHEAYQQDWAPEAVRT